jgi:ribose transport system permease protein
MKKIRISFVNILPLITLGIVILVFTIVSGGKILQLSNIESVLTQSMTVIIGGAGMVFVLSHGGIDLSIGSTACLAAFASATLCMNLGVVAMFAVSIVIGILVGLVVAFFSTRCKVPSFMVTVALQGGLRGIANYAVMTGGVVVASEQLIGFNQFLPKIIVLIVVVAVMWYLFEYTKIGLYNKAIGENELCAKMMGINVVRFKTIAFVICGATAGIVGVFLLARTGGFNNMLGKGFELRVIMALFLGSVPVAGGMDSKMYKVIIGALTICILENGLSVSGITGGVYQLIEGIMLVVVCVLTDFTKKKAALHDEEKMMMLSKKAVSE